VTEQDIISKGYLHWTMSRSIYVISKTDVSSTRNCSLSFASSDQPTTSRQLCAFASFSPAAENTPTSSSLSPRKIKKIRVNMQGSRVTVMSIAAAILLGDKNLYAMFLCAEKADILLLRDCQPALHDHMN
jgi:hypothetical protein